MQDKSDKSTSVHVVFVLNLFLVKEIFPSCYWSALHIADPDYPALRQLRAHNGTSFQYKSCAR